MALIRYPGSKDKVAKQISTYFSNICLPLWGGKGKWDYREPFFGAGAVGFRVIEGLPHGSSVWINDADIGIVSLWKAVHESPRKLINLVQEFEPSAKLFYEYKSRDGTIDGVEGGFAKLALHRMSFSGLGAKAGGPIGGKDQKNAKYGVMCRWNPQSITSEILRINAIFRECSNIEITCGDFGKLIESATSESYLYCDPPYYEKGPDLYKYSMSEHDHERLARMLNASPSKWVLSYDDHPTVRTLYESAKFDDLFMTYSMASTSRRRPKNREVVITPIRPQVSNEKVA